MAAYRSRIVLGCGVVAVLGWVALDVGTPPSLVVRLHAQGTSGDDRHIATGIAIEITRQLAQIEGVDVRAAVSAPLQADQPRDPHAFGVKRGVELVLEGTVLGGGGVTESIHVSLVSISTGRVLWSRGFAPDEGDIFAIQTAIVASVAETLGLPFRPGRRLHALPPALQTPFLKGRALQAEHDDRARLEAVELFEQVAAQAPAFLPAAAALATTIGGHLSISGPPPPNPKMASAAHAAYADDPLMAEANVAMGLLSAGICEWAHADAYFAEALERDPGVPAAHTDYVVSTLLPLGRIADALDVLREARAADPMSVEVGRTLAYVQLLNGDYHDALETSRRVIEQDPDVAFTDQSYGRALYLLGRVEDAHEWFTEGDSRWGHRGYALALMGRHDEARALADMHPDEPARQLLIYAGLNDTQRAFEALVRTALGNPWRALVWMTWPEIEPALRGDARVADLRAQLRRPAVDGGCATSSSSRSDVR